MRDDWEDYLGASPGLSSVYQLMKAPTREALTSYHTPVLYLPSLEPEMMGPTSADLFLSELMVASTNNTR